MSKEGITVHGPACCVMLPPILPSRPRLALLLCLILLIITSLFYLRQPQQVSYAFPNGVLADYTSPATHCFWPTFPEDATSESAEAEEGRGRTAGGGIKSWVGWGSSSSSNGEKLREDADELGTSDNSKFVFQGQMPDMIPVTGIERYMSAHLSELQESYDPQHDFEEYGLSLGNTTLSAYTAELLSTYRRFLSPSKPALTPPSYLPPILSRLSLRPPVAPLPARPKQVMTTEKSLDDLPREFGLWKEIMPNWDIKYFDDRALKNWVKAVLGICKDIPTLQRVL